MAPLDRGAPRPTRESWNINRLLVLAGAALLVAFALLLGGGDLPLFAPGLLAAAALVVWQRPWLYLAAGLLLAAWPLVMLFVFGAVVVLADPTGGVEHLGFTLALGGVLFALVGGVAGFLQGRRGTQPPLREGLRAPQGAFALLALGLLAGAGVTGALASADIREFARSSASNVAADETVAMTMREFAFAPAQVVLPVGKVVALELENLDPVMHTFTWETEDGQVRSTTVPPASQVTVLLEFDAPQRVHFWCEPHAHGPTDRDAGSMWGTLVVE